MIEIKIDNQIIQTTEGKSILEVAKENNINIPNLCHDPELHPYGSCWVCAVKIKGKKGFVTACGTKVYDKMEIISDADEVTKARQMALELLLSDHYADCEAPCKIACPDHVDIQAYVAAIANNDFHQAVKIIKQTLPMPLSIGRVCPAFCEKECRRTLVEEPIAIRQLKRYASDLDLNDVWTWIPEKQEKQNKKVAIVGAGPSGLTCGYYLSVQGYDVDVFESAPQAGGWLRYGIPEYRLPKEILDKEIALMCAHGMKIHTQTEIGSQTGLAQLSKDYDALYLAIGAQKAVDMPVKGSHLKGCYLGVDYLKAVALNQAPYIGKKVAIVGGGNTAIDCARTAKRYGAEVCIIYRRTEQEMPADRFEIDAAHEEGIKFYVLTNPVEYIGNETLKEIRIEKMELGEPDKSGRRSPKATGEFFTEAFDTVIAAISQIPEVQFLAEDINLIDQQVLPLSKWSTLLVDEKTMYSGIANIFGGGDFRRGPSTAIEAIADGRIAAEQIHEFIQNKKFKINPFVFDAKKEKKLKDVRKKEYEQYEKVARVHMEELSLTDRELNFKEVELGYTPSQAIEEAKRCLECGCQVNETCALRSYASEYAIEEITFSGDTNKHPIDDSHPFIRRDANKCIKCGRCIRICSDVQGAGVLGYIYRGFATLVAPEFGESLTQTTCESCGKCIAVCPVGALTEKNQQMKISHLRGDLSLQNCGSCGLGCKIEVDTHAQSIRNISHPQPEHEDFNQRNLCFNGRFAWQIFSDKNRILTPMIKEHGTWKAIDDLTLKALLKDKMNQFEYKHLFVSPRLSLEELLIAQHIQNSGIAQVSTKEAFTDFTDALINTQYRNLRVSQLKNTEHIIIYGKISHTLRTLCRTAQRNGVKLILVKPETSKFNQFADEIASSLESINSPLSSKTIFIYNRYEITETEALDIWKKALTVCDFNEASGVMPTSNWANQHGFALFNFHQDSPQKKGIYFHLNAFEIKRNSDSYHIHVSPYFMPDSEADLFIPSPSYLEIEALSLADDGHLIQYCNPTKSPLFYKLLNVYYEIGLFSPAFAEPGLWNNKVETFLLERRIDQQSISELKEYISSVTPKDLTMNKEDDIHLAQKSYYHKIK